MIAQVGTVSANGDKTIGTIIAEAMDKTVPAVKSLLVRARVALAEKAMDRAA